MGAGTAGPDRRILSAFYTQYVALLLILITFMVGLRAGAPLSPAVSDVAPPSKVKWVAVAPKESASLGEFSIPNIILDDGRVAQENAELLAIVTILRTHDVSAVVRLSIPRLGVHDESSSYRRALRRIEALESFFVEQRVPITAFRIIAEQSSADVHEVRIELTGSSVSRDGGMHVGS